MNAAGRPETLSATASREAVQTVDRHRDGGRARREQERLDGESDSEKSPVTGACTTRLAPAVWAGRPALPVPVTESEWVWSSRRSSSPSACRSGSPSSAGSAAAERHIRRRARVGTPTLTLRSRTRRSGSSSPCSRPLALGHRLRRRGHRRTRSPARAAPGRRGFALALWVGRPALPVPVTESRGWSPRHRSSSPSACTSGSPTVSGLAAPAERQIRGRARGRHGDAVTAAEPRVRRHRHRVARRLALRHGLRRRRDREAESRVRGAEAASRRRPLRPFGVPRPVGPS